MHATETSVERTTTLSRETKSLAVRFETRLRMYRRLSQMTNANNESSIDVTMPRRFSEDATTKENELEEGKYGELESRNILNLFQVITREYRQGRSIPLQAQTLCSFHKRLFCDLPVKDLGSFRSDPIQFGQWQGPDAREVPQLVEALLAWGSSPKTKILPGLPNASQVIKAAALHTSLLSIHPFADGNGRVTRALEFALLLQAGLPVQLAHELHNWYNSDRSLYCAALNNSREKGVDWFLRYALEGFNQQLDQRIQAMLKALPFGRRHFLRAGFTLIEIVVVLLILGILAGVAAPRLFDTYDDASETSEAELVRRINDGLEYYYLERLSEGSPAYPSELDDASSALCTSKNPCFTNVLKRGIIDGSWKKTDPDEYVGPSGTSYSYDPVAGTFEEE